MTEFLPAKRNFPVWIGATFRYQFQWLEDDGKVRTPRDLTGYSGEAKLDGNDGTELILSTGNGGVILGGRETEDPTNALIEMYISDEQTPEITWKKATYTLYLTEPNAPHDRYPLLAGQFHAVRVPL